MQRSKAFACLFLSILLLSSLFVSGCRQAPPSALTDPTTNETTPNTTERTDQTTMDKTPVTTPEEKPNTPIKPLELVANTYHLCNNRENFKRYGRMTEHKDGLTCDFTASGIEFYGILQGDVILSLSCSADTYFTVFIDNVRQEERFYATSTTEQLCIASFAEAGEHTVRVLKQTEAQWSLCVLKNVSVTGFLYPAPAEREFLIEFIGDSITSGYGNLGDPSTPVAGIALMQDGTQAFAFLTAESLDVDHNMVSCSGIGIAKGWTAINELDFYQRDCYYRDPDARYHGSVRSPDLIVINLGTNDQDRGCEEQAFKSGMRKLLTYIREQYPDVPIIWMYNMMTYGCFTWARPIIAEFGGEGAGIYTLQLTPNKLGAGNHPSLEAHYAASEQLTAFIKEKNLLDNVN